MNITRLLRTLLMTIPLVGLGLGLGFLAYPRLPGQPPAGPRPGAVAAAQPRQGQPREGPGRKSDQERILGTWRFSGGMAEGREVPAEYKALARLVFTRDGKAIISIAGENSEGQYKLVGPGKIDLTLNPREQPSPAIYKFEGDDRFTLCGAKDAAGKRPQEFTAERDSGQVLFVLTRARPGEEKPSAEDIARYKEPVARVREAAARTISANHLRQIGVAMHLYLDTHKTFPAHAIYSKDGKTPLLSWRVALLPYLDQKALYDEFKLDEPWDSAHNKKLIARMPEVYQAGSAGPGLTYYQVFTGPSTLFDGARKMGLADVVDGTSNTLLVIEAKEPVEWTRPADLVLPRQNEPMPAVGGLFKTGTNALFCDGAVRFVSANIAPALLRSLVTPKGGD